VAALSPAEAYWLPQVLGNAATAIEVWLSEADLGLVMRFVNRPEVYEMPLDWLQALPPPTEALPEAADDADEATAAADGAAEAAALAADAAGDATEPDVDGRRGMGSLVQNCNVSPLQLTPFFQE